MEPARLNCLCDHGAAARGSFAPLTGDGKREFIESED
jgi:hypothetical protein